MLKEIYKEIKKNTIIQLCTQDVISQNILVQAFDIKLTKSGKLTCNVSDGNFYVKAFFKQNSALTPEKHQNSLICVKQHVVADSGKKIGIIEIQIICDYGILLGNPKQISQSINMMNPQEVKPFQIQMKWIKNKYVAMQQISSAPRSQIKSKNNNSNVKLQQKRQMRLPQPKPLTGSIKDYETIKDLFIGLRGWNLLCRIVKLNYQQFPKKNEPTKLVKVLNIQLMDKSNIKIAGTFFYEAAIKFRQQLKLNSVYKISQGSIANQSYTNSRNQKMSPFKLIFSLNSKFQQVSDVNVIAKPQDTAITLNQLLQKGVFNQQFDIIGILTQIEAPKQMHKGDRSFSKCNLLICDPICKKSLHAVTWNDKIKVDETMIGKPVILSHFTLHDYNGSLSLTAKARANIQISFEHYYSDYVEAVMKNYKDYQFLSDSKIKYQQKQNVQSFKNLKQLETAIDSLERGKSIKSDLNISLSRISTKKWYYQGCPSCNKAAQKNSSCHCGKYVTDTIPHFIMPIQICDNFGSLWTTSYDDQSKKIFWGEEGVINKLMKFDTNQLKDVVEDYLFQQFKVRINTKRDEQGRIKHIITKFEILIPQKTAQQNMLAIKNMMMLQ